MLVKPYKKAQKTQQNLKILTVATNLLKIVSSEFFSELNACYITMKLKKKPKGIHNWNCRSPTKKASIGSCKSPQK